MVMWRYTYTYVCIACACTCTTQVLPHISILCFAHPHFPIGARCTRESQHALPRLKNNLRAHMHADVIFCHMHMTWCTCACTYVLHAHVCAQIQHFLTFQNFASHVHVFRSVHVAIARGSHSMRCHVASPQEQTRAHADIDVKNNVIYCTHAHRYRITSALRFGYFFLRLAS